LRTHLTKKLSRFARKLAIISTRVTRSHKYSDNHEALWARPGGRAMTSEKFGWVGHNALKGELKSH